ncbi:hypothetical protein PINS_up001102 [Pythium insidiosum]|nr:hypothetical protein PINS_up001102 [Pythium insidiosum]
MKLFVAVSVCLAAQALNVHAGYVSQPATTAPAPVAAKTPCPNSSANNGSQPQPGKGGYPAGGSPSPVTPTGKPDQGGEYPTKPTQGPAQQPKPDVSKPEAPKTDVPKTEGPKPYGPSKPDLPKSDAPSTRGPKPEPKPKPEEPSRPTTTPSPATGGKPSPNNGGSYPTPGSGNYTPATRGPTPDQGQSPAPAYPSKPQDKGPKSSDPLPKVTNGGVNLYPYTPDIRDYIVEKHNWARANLVPSEAANMRKVRWDESLAIEASELVHKCVFEHDTEDYAYGQNLMYGNQKIDRETVDSWMKGWVADELSANDKAGTGFMDLDHASAVLWANTYLVGCASKMCPDGYLTACNYFTPGNWQGERTYIPGKSCSQCPSQAPYCDASGKLCVGDGAPAPAPAPGQGPAPAPVPNPVPAPGQNPVPAPGPANKPSPGGHYPAPVPAGGQYPVPAPVPAGGQKPAVVPSAGGAYPAPAPASKPSPVGPAPAQNVEEKSLPAPTPAASTPSAAKQTGKLCHS